MLLPAWLGAVLPTSGTASFRAGLAGKAWRAGSLAFVGSWSHGVLSERGLAQATDPFQTLIGAEFVSGRKPVFRPPLLRQGAFLHTAAAPMFHRSYRFWLAVWLLGVTLPLVAASRDPGLRVTIDLTRFELVASDPRSGEAPLVLAVATGSPGQPTPTGHYRPRVVVRNPGWRPGSAARAGGAIDMAPGELTPMGVAKIPLDPSGFALHGGASPIVVGKPVSLGCVRLSDADMQSLLDWLDRAGALARPRPERNGEIHQALRRRLALEVR